MQKGEIGTRATTFACALLATAWLVPAAHALDIGSTGTGSYPGANGKIAFTSARDGNHEIYVMNADGSAQSNLTSNTAKDEAPAWSPDGTKIAFLNDSASGSCFAPCLYAMNADGTAVTPLGYIVDDGYGFEWSPDAERLLFGRFDEGLYTIKPDGTDLVWLGDEGTRTHGQPAWAPDDSEIAFVGGSGMFGWFVARIEPDGTYIGAIPGSTDDCGGSLYPNWSPDSSKIAFMRGSCGTPTHLYTANRDGTGATDLTVGSNSLVNEPMWSPDGSKLAVTRLSAGGGEIVTMNANGTNQTPLTTNSVQDESPDWQPLHALDPYPRPGGGTPLLVWFVPAYEPCTSPNTTHTAPLALGSCTPPDQTSSLLTMGTIGQGKSSVRLEAMLGDPMTPADEADVRIEASLGDVRNAATQADYTGDVLVRAAMRLTDRAAGFGGVSATTQDFNFDVPVSCTATAETPRGANCTLSTTADSLVPGFAKEKKRSVIATPSFSVLDAGADGSLAGPACPLTCGTGDEQSFLAQGTFLP